MTQAEVTAFEAAIGTSERELVTAAIALPDDAIEAGATVEAALDGGKELAHVSLGFDEGRKRAWLFERGLVEAEAQDEDGFALTVRWNPRQEAQFRQL